MIKLIVQGKEQSNISEAAKEWLYDSIFNGNKGPFRIESNNKNQSIFLDIEKESKQERLF